VRVIPNGLDTQIVDAEDTARLRTEFRSSHSIPNDAPVVGTLGELKELKGQREFVLAAAEIVKKVPDCRFVIVGLDNTMDKRFRRDLKRLAQVSGIEDQILWLDWLEDTAPFYAAIDVFVSPSHSESFGLAILEAMGNGKAIVSTATDGAQQLLRDCGTLVGVNDVVGMADAILRLLADPDVLGSFGRSAKKIAAERYSLDRMIAATEKLYSELLSESPASSFK
jgi:glycosyltransferase involved in cell wall biosynthesis